MADSLILSEHIELLGGGQASNIAECTGVMFRLAPGFTLGANDPVPDLVASLVLDGERPEGERSSNRVITLPVAMVAPQNVSEVQARILLAGAREVLSRACDQPYFTLKWTREGMLPLIFDCYRNTQEQPVYVLPTERQGVMQTTVSFPAQPYGRSDTAIQLNFPSPIIGQQPASNPVTLDSFGSVSGTNWAASTQTPTIAGGGSAFWDPTVASDPTGIGLAASYSKSGLTGINMSQGWAVLVQGNSLLATTFAVTAAVDAPKMDIGNTFVFVTNSLTGDDSTFEGGTVGNWYGGSNCSVSNTTAQAHSGTHALQISSTAAGTMTAQSNTSFGAPGAPVKPGDVCWASGWVRAATVVRACLIGVAFYDALGDFLSTGFAFETPTNDSTTAWTQLSSTLGVIAPNNAAFAQPVVQVQSTGGAAEIHYADDMWLGTRSGAQVPGTVIYTVTGISTPFAGFDTVTFSPPAPSGPLVGQVAVQVGPPQLAALSMWAGFGSTKYFHHWAREGGPVHFLFTLTDNLGNILTFSKVYYRIRGSPLTGAPKWWRIRATIPFSTTFNYQNITAYSVQVTNSQGNPVPGPGGRPGIPNVFAPDLRYTQLYIAQLQAVPIAVQQVQLQRGVIYDLAGVIGSARAPANFQFQQTGSPVATTVTFGTPGTYQWLCPFGVSLVSNVEVIGGGGAASIGIVTTLGTGGGSAGSSGNAVNVAVTAGNLYTVVVGRGAEPWPNSQGLTGAEAGLSSFAGDSVTVSAPGGLRTKTFTTTGASAPAAGTPAGFAGGPGGAGANSSTGGGGGGGSSAGTSGAGNAGGAASGSTGGAAGAAVAGGGPGGKGGSYVANKNLVGSKPAIGYGGAAGGNPANPNGFFAAGLPFQGGFSGMVQLQYNLPPQFKTLLVHRPAKNADPNLCPFVTIPTGDPVDGTVSYFVPSLTPGIQPRFGGTYSVVVVSNTWSNPTASRTITVNVGQVEQGGGSVYNQSIPFTFTPSNLINNSPFVVLGNLTIPLNEVPPENTQGYFTASITDTVTADTFYDILFLDTQGSTVILSTPNSYANWWIDEPLADRDIGLILGSATGDRTTAVSVLQGYPVITGGPLTVDPHGNQSLLVYAVEGAPSCQVIYKPRWLYDRLA